MESELFVRDLRSKEQLLKEELDQLNEEKSGFLTRRARFEFDIKDAEDETNQANMTSVQAQEALVKLEGQISSAEERLNTIRPEYDELRSKEMSLSHEREVCDQKRAEIFAKQGRSTRFRTKEDRDKWIKNELKTISKAVDEKRSMATRLAQELAEEQTRAQQFKEEIAKYSKRMDEQQVALDDSERENFELVRKKEELQTARNDLWRTETQLTQEVSQMRDEVQKCEQNLRSVTGKTVLQGSAAI